MEAVYAEEEAVACYARKLHVAIMTAGLDMLIGEYLGSMTKMGMGGSSG